MNAAKLWWAALVLLMIADSLLSYSVRAQGIEANPLVLGAIGHWWFIPLKAGLGVVVGWLLYIAAGGRYRWLLPIVASIMALVVLWNIIVLI